MLFGHAAVGSLAQQTAFRGQGLPFLVAAAYGPDWLDKPLKFFFHIPGHGYGHTGLLFLLLCFVGLWAGKQRPGMRPLLRAALVLWGVHLLCDWVDPHIFFWPFFGFFIPNPHPESMLFLACQFYGWPEMHPLAWIDLFLVATAVCARLLPLASRMPRTGPGRAAWRAP